MFRRTGIAALAVTVAALTGCADRPSMPARLADPAQGTPRDLREHVNANGVLAGVEAGQQLLVVQQVQQSGEGGPTHVIRPKPPAAPPPPVAVVRPVPPTPPTPPQVVHVRTPAPAPPRPAVIKFSVRSEKPAPSEAVAFHDAVAAARLEVMRRLDQMDPPVRVSPSLVTVRTEFVKEKRPVVPSEADKEEWKKNGLNPNQTYVEVDVEVSEAQVQRLRSAERVSTALHVAGLLFVVLLAVHGFFRLDAWTKGYLTGWLGLAAVVLVLGTALIMLA